MGSVSVEVGGVARPVLRAVQQAVDVVEDVPLAEFPAIPRPVLAQRPVGDVLAPVAAVYVVGVEGEALEAVCSVEEAIQSRAVELYGAELSL